MKRAVRWMALALGTTALAACEESPAACGRATVHTVRVRYLKDGWDDGAYRLHARYRGEHGDHEVRCDFTLPGGRDAQCTEPIHLKVGATVSLVLPDDSPARIDLELERPNAESRVDMIAPAYDETPTCAGPDRIGAALIDLDE